MQKEEPNHNKIPKNEKKNPIVVKEDEFSSIDPSLLKELMKSEENQDEPEPEPEPEAYDEEQEDAENEDYINNAKDNHSEGDEGNENNSKHFTGEIVNVEEEEDEEDHIENLQHTPSKLQKVKYNSQGMERISEAENEDEKYPTLFDKFNQEALKEEYRLNDKNFDEVMGKEIITSKNINKLFQPALYNNEAEIFKFKPEINAKSKQIAVEKVEKERNKSSDNISSRSKLPVEYELYNDAKKRKEKMEKVEYNHMMTILLNSSKTKISNNSHKIAINKIEKMIEAVVEKREKQKKISFINAGEILTDLKIFREVLPVGDNSTEIKKNYQSYKDIKAELRNVREVEKRKQMEVDFYEQLWLTLNPANKDCIKSDIFSEFLKILFSPVASSVKEISSILKQFLLAAFFLNSNPDEVKRYISPITEKVISEEDIWPLDKIVKEFLVLKENILAYQGIGNMSKTLKKDMDREKKTFSFHPKTNDNPKGEFKSRSRFFEERLPALLDREKLRKQVLDEMKKESEQTDLKNCTFKPQINKKSDNMKDSLFSPEVPVYDKLYKLNKEQKKKMETRLEEKKVTEATKELTGCTFKPNLISQKSFEKSISSAEKPKGFYQSIDRMRRGILAKMHKKYLVKKIPVGENYEKVKRANIKPFDITDLRKKDKEKEKEKEKEEEENAGNNEAEEDYFTIQIKIPSGKDRTLKIFTKDEPYDIAESFCKVYGMKDEIKQRLTKTILYFRTLYLQKNQKEKNNEEDQEDNNLISSQDQFHNNEEI